MLIGSLPGYVSLGEVTHALNRANRDAFTRNCSCGKAPKECPVWQSVIERTAHLTIEQTSERYRILDVALIEHFGANYCLVDSSKRTDVLKTLNTNYPGKLKVIFLVKDLKHTILSQMAKPQPQAKAKIRGQKFGIVLSKFPTWVGFYYNWLKRNLEITIFLKRNNIDHLRIGYNEIGESKQTSERYLLEYLNESEEILDFSYSKSTHHMLLGNKTFIYGTRQSGFQYDKSWDAKKLPFLCRLAIKPALGINNRLTRSNGNGARSKCRRV